MKNNKEGFLTSPIALLDVSGAFKQMAEINGFETIDQLLTFPLSALQKREGFTAHIVHELSGILIRENSLHLLKQF